MSTRRFPSFCLDAIVAASAFASPAALSQTAAPSGVGYHQTLRLNDTGLTRCTRDFNTFTTDCAGTGQDAESGRDVLYPSGHDGHGGFAFRKVCNSGQFAGTGTCTKDAAPGAGPDDWGCTYDKVTQLTWEVKTADGGLRDAAARYTDIGDGRAGDTSSYTAAVNGQVLCGASDWRLPTTHELQGLVNFNRATPHPSIDPAYFPNTLRDHYWTSEPVVGQEGTVAWIVSFVMDPHNVNVTGWSRNDPNPAMLVRADAVPIAAPALDAPGADEFLDARAHLIWKRCSEHQTWDGTTCTGKAKTYNFGAALAEAQQQAAATGLPWRLPNAKELHAIVDHAHAGPAVDPAIFPNTPSALYWTSTAYAWTATGAWAINFSMGDVLAYASGYQFYIRLVRDAK